MTGGTGNLTNFADVHVRITATGLVVTLKVYFVIPRKPTPSRVCRTHTHDLGTCHSLINTPKPRQPFAHDILLPPPYHTIAAPSPPSSFNILERSWSQCQEIPREQQQQRRKSSRPQVGKPTYMVTESELSISFTYPNGGVMLIYFSKLVTTLLQQ